MRRSNVLRTWCLVALLTLPVAAWGGEAGKLKILLLGDSTTIGSVCRQADPDGPHLEDVIRLLLATEKDLPPSEVINQGRDGEYIRGLLSSGRYDKEIAPLGGVDYVLIRYGLNDLGKREEFEVNFPKDYAELIGRLRRDYPRATIVPMTIIPYMTPERDEAINALIRKVAESERLTLFDVYARYRAELSHGPNMLNYRRYPLEKIPERHREWVKPFVRGGQVVVMDNRLDAHFRELPGWFGDRHPNLAGYHVIGDESARFLAKLIREKKTTAAEVTRDRPAKLPAESTTKATGVLFAEAFDDARLTERGWYDGRTFAISREGTLIRRRLHRISLEAGHDDARDAHRASAGCSNRRRAFTCVFTSSSHQDGDWTGRSYHPHLMHFMTTENEKYHGPAASHLTVYIEPQEGKLRLAAQDIENQDMPHGLTQGPLRGGYNGKFYDSKDVLFKDDKWHCVEALFKLNSLDPDAGSSPGRTASCAAGSTASSSSSART